MTDIKQLPDRWELPTDPGWYMWYIVDLGYMNVGMVNIIEDSPQHLAWLRERQNDGMVYIYNTISPDIMEVFGPRYLTMYHQAHDHLPPCDKDGKPFVDGYLPFDFRLIRCLPKHFEKKHDS